MVVKTPRTTPKAIIKAKKASAMQILTSFGVTQRDKRAAQKALDSVVGHPEATSRGTKASLAASRALPTKKTTN